MIVIRCFLLELLCFISAESLCQFKLDNRPSKYNPLIINEEGDFIYPKDETRVLKFDEGEVVGLFCAQAKTKRYLKSVKGATKTKQYEPLFAYCSGTDFINRENDEVVDVEGAKCSGALTPDITKVADLCSNLGADGRDDDLDGNLFKVTIGWNITTLNRFIPQIELCHDDKVYGTLWTKASVLPEVKFKDGAVERQDFRSDNRRKSRFYGGASSSSLERIYSKKYQLEMAEALLGKDQTAININSSSTFYFAKGHMAPYASFVYVPQQQATNYYINVAPQFQAFNNGNWKILEGKTTDLAISKKRKLTSYVGTVDILSYSGDANNNAVEMELWYQHEPPTIPVPMFYWRVIHDPTKNEALAFLGLNDPHVEDFSSFLCENICDQIDWIKNDESLIDMWDTELKGEMTCCRAEDLYENVNFAPDLRNEDGEWPILMTSEF